MVFIAFALILLGGFTAIFGHNLFRAILPLVGLVAGVMVGFGGVQGVFGTGVISTTIALLMAVVVGVVMALLSFVFFEVAVTVLSAMAGAALASYLGVVLGLGENGFLLALLSIAGAVLGFVFATSRPLMSSSFVIVLTSFVGVSFAFAGVMLLVGETNLDTLQNQGIIASVIDVADQSFLWLLGWIGAALLAMNVQKRLLMYEIINNNYVFIEKTK